MQKPDEKRMSRIDYKAIYKSRSYDRLLFFYRDKLKICNKKTQLSISTLNQNSAIIVYRNYCKTA